MTIKKKLEWSEHCGDSFC